MALMRISGKFSWFYNYTKNFTGMAFLLIMESAMCISKRKNQVKNRNRVRCIIILYAFKYI